MIAPILECLSVHFRPSSLPVAARRGV
jgi:hypothetical protein